MMRQLLWWYRQRFRTNKVQARPGLDLVDFGSSRCIILDVGASRGGFASNILIRAPLSEVHCFEPNPEIAAVLESSAQRFGRLKGAPRCIVNAVGVGNRVETRKLIVTQMHEASSFLALRQVTRDGWPNMDFAQVADPNVDIIRLEDYLNDRNISAVKLLKLDVQGFELEALRGCGERLRDVEYVISEIQFTHLYENAPLWNEIVAYLDDYEFRPVVMDGFCFSPEFQPLQADILFKREERGR